MIPNHAPQGRPRLPLNLLAAPALLALLLACGGGGGGSAPPSGGGITGQTINVGAAGNFFSPETLTVKAGTPVTFVWITGGHSVSSGTACNPSGLFGGSTVLAQGQTMQVPTSVTNTPGTYPFYCTPHCAGGAGMKGTLIVTP